MRENPMKNTGTLSQQFSLFNTETQVADEVLVEVPPVGKYSNYIVYVDESGDHGLQNLDANYPVFVLAFCIFHKRHYSEKVVPALQKFKFNHFGHDLVVLHEHEIRKEKGAFNFFQSRQHKHGFLKELTNSVYPPQRKRLKRALRHFGG